MSIQQLIVLLAIAAAALYLGRNLWRAWLRFRSPSGSGCASGCGKCGYAGPDASERAPREESPRAEPRG